MRLMKNNKAQVGSVSGLIMSIITAAVLLAIGLLILSQIQTASDYSAGAQCRLASFPLYNSSNDICLNGTGSSVLSVPVNHTAASVATGSVVDKLSQVPTWIGIIVIVGLAMVVLAFFYKGKMGK